MVAAACALALGVGPLVTGSTLGVGRAAAETTAPAGPDGVVLSVAGPALLELRWNAAAGANGYTVTSDPPGLGCSTVDTSCTMDDSASTPWRFSVEASFPDGTSSVSATVGPVRTRPLVVVAGQSNAVGFEAHPNDRSPNPPLPNAADWRSRISWLPGEILVPSPTPTPRYQPVALSAPQRFRSSMAYYPGEHIFGPEVGVARTLWADRALPITVVKAASGGTSLAKDWDPAVAGGLYARMVLRVERVMALDAQRGVLDVPSGLVWYQGESDALNLPMATAYQANLAAFISQLREDLPGGAGLPVVLIKESIAEFTNVLEGLGVCVGQQCDQARLGDRLVRAADDAVAARLPKVATVDSVDLPRRGLLIHLSGAGELAVGSRSAAALEPMLP